ncbi:hypothetical protein TNCV_4188461 [Trichonephila clavipes]|nr:hypothetical protein TNCV_4188461 [Trichonephila clavipes]
MVNHCTLHHGHFGDPLKTAYTSDAPSASHNIQYIDLTELTMNFKRRDALCIQELYHQPKLTGDGRRISISDYCYHATGTRRDLSGWHMIHTS